MPLGAIDVGQGIELSGRIQFLDGKFHVPLSGGVGMPFEAGGFGVTASVEFVYTTSIDPAEQTVENWIEGSASLLGVSVPLPPPPLPSPLPVPTPASGVSALFNAVRDPIKDAVVDVILQYLLRWANELEELAEDCADYVVEFGDAIVDAATDAFNDVFGGGSDGPLPPILANAFVDAAPLGDVMLQWGQHAIATDSAKAFAFSTPFGGGCKAALANPARSGVMSALAVSARAAGSFTLNRDDAILGVISFHWLALGGAPGKGIADKGAVTIGDVVLQWGSFVVDRAGSEIDGSREFFWLAIGR